MMGPKAAQKLIKTWKILRDDDNQWQRQRETGIIMRVIRPQNRVIVERRNLVHAMSSFSIRKKGKTLEMFVLADACESSNQATKSSDEYTIYAVWSTPCIFCIACGPPFLFGHPVPGQKAYKHWARP